MKSRRVLAILASICLLFCMVGCGAKEPTTTTTTVAPNNGATFTDAYAYVTEKPLDGQVLTTHTPRTFFGSNSFYTTAANRMSRHVMTNAVTAEHIIARLQADNGA